MPDIYNLTTPFGLLDDEIRAALVKHADDQGELQVFESDGWSEPFRMNRHSRFFQGRTYRAFRASDRPMSVPWGALRDTIICVARDHDGIVYGFFDKPTPDFKTLRWDGWTFRGLNNVVKFDPGTKPWHDSLVWRPGYEPDAENAER